MVCTFAYWQQWFYGSHPNEDGGTFDVTSWVFSFFFYIYIQYVLTVTLHYKSCCAVGWLESLRHVSLSIQLVCLRFNMKLHNEYCFIVYSFPLMNDCVRYSKGTWEGFQIVQYQYGLWKKKKKKKSKAVTFRRCNQMLSSEDGVPLEISEKAVSDIILKKCVSSRPWRRRPQRRLLHQRSDWHIRDWTYFRLHRTRAREPGRSCAVFSWPRSSGPIWHHQTQCQVLAGVV